MSVPSAAQLGEFGVDPSWSKFVDVPSHSGGTHRWHILERPGMGADAPTILCIHGNPTWSFLWSRLMSEITPAFRVLAPDQLSMGFSDHIGARPYRDRVGDIHDLVTALDIYGPLWIVAQDWGGAIAMGYATSHRAQVAGLILSNTGIAIPAGRKAPRLIRISASSGLHRLITRTTSLFVRGTGYLPGAGLTKQQRRALVAPYLVQDRRIGVAGFVADVPFDEKHPSSCDLASVAAELQDLNIPVRLYWGSKDPVFNDDFADDLMSRFSDVEIHRIPRAGHLAVLETSMAPFVESVVSNSLQAISAPSDDDQTCETLWARIDSSTRPDALAISDAAAKTSVTFSEFESRVASFAQSLSDQGVKLGDRVAVLVPPSIDLIAVVYACWRVGAITVIADRGLGIKGLGAAVRSARVQHVVGPQQAVTAARVLRWAPRSQKISVASLSTSRTVSSLAQITVPAPTADDLAAVLFTSGATGPAKGVRYTHRQLGAQRDALQKTYDITADDRFVAAFAPFALFGPALGITTGLADMDVTSPSTLTAEALNQACQLIDATMVFASPAALANVVRTAGGSLPAVSKSRLVMSAGAPVPLETLQKMQALCPQAELHTPYGMTEVLPVADLSLAERTLAGSGRGVCVGHAVEGCELMIAAADTLGDLVPLDVGTTGEVVVCAAWMSSGYDRLWQTQIAARPILNSRTWHRTGDVGHLDISGNLWIEGRLVHVIHTASGQVTPVPLEISCERVIGVARAAAVGIGPRGTQQVVIVVELDDASEGPAGTLLTQQIRQAVAPQSVASVWVVKKLPVDIRHNSKIDRSALGLMMQDKLSGSRR